MISCTYTLACNILLSCTAVNPGTPRAEEKEEKKAEEDEEGGFSMSAKDQLTMDDYVLPYVDDSDTEDEGN